MTRRDPLAPRHCPRIAEAVQPTTIYRGQAYWPLGTEPCIRRDGKPAILMLWRSRCAQCGQPFEFKRSIKATFVPNRRCDKHKRAGVRVRRLGEWEGSQ
jgi:hypothetical protein